MEEDVATIMSTWPETVAVFLRHRMHCVGCQVGPFHTIKDVCAEYHLDEAEFRRELQCAISAPRKGRPE